MKGEDAKVRRTKLEQALGASRYLVGRELGNGPRATVYVTRDVLYPDLVAVKAFRDAPAFATRRLLRQISLTSTVAHRNIMPLFDWGEFEGIVFYTMPFAEAGSLRQRLSTTTVVSPEAALRILRDIAAALTIAHAHDIAHGNVTAENVLFVGPRTMLSDAGICRGVGATAATDVLDFVRLFHEVTARVEAKSAVPSVASIVCPDHSGNAKRTDPRPLLSMLSKMLGILSNRAQRGDTSVAEEIATLMDTALSEVNAPSHAPTLPGWQALTPSPDHAVARS